MTSYEITISKIQKLPQSVLQEVDDYVDYLLLKNKRKKKPTSGSHPIMAAFGLWRDVSDFQNLSDEIYANRVRQGSRTGVSL